MRKTHTLVNGFFCVRAKNPFAKEMRILKGLSPLSGGFGGSAPSLHALGHGEAFHARLGFIHALVVLTHGG